MEKLIRRTIAPCTVLAVLALTCAASFAEDAVANPEPPVLRDVMWQMLPAVFRDVTVGPDGRAWWTARTPRLDADATCRLIEREFDKESPVLYGARPVLFEPGGRVWFEIRAMHIRGYDGERWINIRSEGGWFRGNCPGHGRRGGWDFGHNCMLGGKVFLLALKGVHCYDRGTDSTSYQPMLDREASRTALAPEPDGKGLVAFYLGVGFGEKFSVFAFWRWRDNTWTQIEMPPDIARKRLTGMRVEADGVWVQEYWRDNRDTKPGEPLNYVRPRFVPFDPQEKGKPADGDLTFVVGQYTAREVILGFEDTTEARYLRARQVTCEGKELGPGMLIDQPDGRITFLPGERFRTRFYSFDQSGPVMVPGGGAVWIPGVRGSRPADLYSLDDGKLISGMPKARIFRVSAVLGNGTVFASGGGNGKLIAYRHAAEDDRKFLEHQLIRGSRACIAPDGSIWVVRRVGPDQRVELLRFDGKEWTVVLCFDDRNWIVPKPLLAMSSIRVKFLPGHNGEMLLLIKDKFIFLVGDKVYADEDIQALIEAHKKEFAAAYFMGVPSSIDKKLQIAADKAGNIWVLGWYGRNTIDSMYKGTLKVLVGDKWLEPGPALRKLGSPSGKVAAIAAVGDGSIIYMNEPDLFHPERVSGLSFYGEVVDGAFVFVPAPHCSLQNVRYLHRNVRDHNGGLWVPISAGHVHLPGDECISGRLTDNFEEEIIRIQGRPIMCDQSGNVWFGSKDRADDAYKIWSPDGAVGSCSVPFVGRYDSFQRLFSDRPGSVYIWTRRAIFHLTADDPAQPASYTFKEQYFVDVKGMQSFIGFSKLGYIVLKVRGSGKTGSGLCIVKLPGPEDD